MKMKRFIAVMMSICMMSAVALTGCGDSSAANGNDENTGNGSTGSTDTDKNGTNEAGSTKGYVFESNGVKISVDADMAPIAEALGEPEGYFEEPSCAAQGTARLYTYSGFEIDTYPDGDKDLIACIILKDDTVATPEGVDLSMTKEKVIEVYGEDYEETEGKIAYEKDGMKLCFILEGDYIVSIEYDSAVLN